VVGGQCQWGSLASCRGEETVVVAWGFGLDGPQPPAAIKPEGVGQTVCVRDGRGQHSHMVSPTVKSKNLKARDWNFVFNTLTQNKCYYKFSTFNLNCYFPHLACLTASGCSYKLSFPKIANIDLCLQILGNFPQTVRQSHQLPSSFLDPIGNPG